jgi:segregation and condensation protein B
LSAAALETLAIVAYKQPVSRAQIGAIRGVNADAVIRTLQTRGYITEVGRDPGPGQALLYGTTTLFLEKLGLDRLDDLPPLAEFVPGPEIMDALENSLRADRSSKAEEVPADAGIDDEDEAEGDAADRS